MTDPTDLFARRLRPSPEAMVSRVGDESVLLHLGDDTYYGLDATGTEVWEGLAAGATLADLRDRIAARHAVEPARVGDDLRRFANDLIGRGLLVEG